MQFGGGYGFGSNSVYMWNSPDTVKSDCPAQIFRKNYEIFKDLKQTVGLPY